MNQDKPIFVPHSNSDDSNQTPTETPVTPPTPAPAPIPDPAPTTESPIAPASPQADEPATEPKAAEKPAEAEIPVTPVAPVTPKIDFMKQPPVATNSPANQEPDLAATMFPPKKSPAKSATIATSAVVAVLFIAIGFAGGFFGFQYSPKIAGLIKTSADSDATKTATDSTQPQSTNATPSEVAAWPIYNNTTYLYSAKYPDNWYSQNTNDATAKTVTFTNYAPQSKTNTEEKIEISTQSANKKELKAWVDAHNTVTANTAALTKLTISGQDAYQQETTGENRSITTYIKQGQYIITIVYSADSGVYNEGKAIYNKFVEAFKLS